MSKLPDPTVPETSLPGKTGHLDQSIRAQWEAVLKGTAEDAARWITAAARHGHSEAQAVIGQWTLDGHGVPRDPAAALHWFLLSASQGNVMGMNMAGRCHEQGWGTPVDESKAAHWYRQASRKGMPEARYNLANLLASGKGVKLNHAEAVALYRQAADQGYAKACAKLGRYHEDGLVVTRDSDAALQLYRRGAEGGDVRGQFCYAGMLASQGRRSEAITWLQKVSESGNSRYLRQAGTSLQEAKDPAFQAIGRYMLQRALECDFSTTTVN